MYTYSARPKTIEEVQTTIEKWFGSRYKQAKPPYTLYRKSEEPWLDMSILRPAFNDLKVEMNGRCLLFQVKHTRLNLNLEGFLVRTAYEGKRFGLRIEPDPGREHHLLVSIFDQLSETKYPAFCARMLRAVKGLESELTSDLIDEATAAPTDHLVMVEAVSLAPWASELAVGDPIIAAKLRGIELRQEMLKKSGGALSSGRVAELLDVSRQAIDKRRAANQLLALTQGKRGYSYPGFQFEEGKALKGLEDVLEKLSALDPWMQLVFFTSPNERLGNKTPIDALRSGKINDVVTVASGYGEQGAL